MLDALNITDSMIIGAPPGGNGFCRFFDCDIDATSSLNNTVFFNGSIDPPIPIRLTRPYLSTTPAPGGIFSWPNMM
jgi:hypothetical protein